jgi:hypothetical protein
VLIRPARAQNICVGYRVLTPDDECTWSCFSFEPLSYADTWAGGYRILLKYEPRWNLFIFFNLICKNISPFQNLSVVITKRRDAGRPPWATAVGFFLNFCKRPQNTKVVCLEKLWNLVVYNFFIWCRLCRGQSCGPLNNRGETHFLSQITKHKRAHKS